MLDFLKSLTMAENMNVISLINMFSTIFIALVALFFTVKTYNFKKGQAIRGSFTTSSSIYCDYKYVSTIELENCKDKSIAIYKIYLRFGLDVYIELETFEEKPLILNPFEVYKANYDPVNCYLVNLRKVDWTHLLDVVGKKKPKKKPRIVLSTSNGRYIVKKEIKHWDPILLWFKNITTAIVRIDRQTYDGVCYGNAEFLIIITLESGKVVKQAIWKNENNIFKDFNINKNDIKSKSSLENVLQQQINNKVVNWKKIEVIDLKENYNKYIENRYEDEIKINSDNIFKYLILGRIYTIFENYKLYRENKKIRERNRENSSE